jgi:putative ABC transport system permease protein
VGDARRSIVGDDIPIGGVVQGLSQNAKFRVRILQKNPTFTLIRVRTFAITVGAGMVISTFVEGVPMMPLTHYDQQTMAEIWNTNLLTLAQIGFSQGDSETYGQRSHELPEIVQCSFIGPSFNLAHKCELLLQPRLTYDTPNLFPLLGVHLVARHAFGPEKNNPGYIHIPVVNHRISETHFDSIPQVVGQIINQEGNASTLIGFLRIDSQIVAWIDSMLFINLTDLNRLTSRVFSSSGVNARRRLGVDNPQSNEKLPVLANRVALEPSAANQKVDAFIHGLGNSCTAQVRRTLFVLFSSAFFVLLFACAEMLDLLLYNNVIRGKNIALRTPIGLSKSTMLRRLLAEVLLSSFIDGILGFFPEFVGSELVSSLLPSDPECISDAELSGRVSDRNHGLSFIRNCLWSAPALHQNEQRRTLA